jgi:hypothetical protein
LSKYAVWRVLACCTWPRSRFGGAHDERPSGPRRPARSTWVRRRVSVPHGLSGGRSALSPISICSLPSRRRRWIGSH